MSVELKYNRIFAPTVPVLLPIRTAHRSFFFMELSQIQHTTTTLSQFITHNSTFITQKKDG